MLWLIILFENNGHENYILNNYIYNYFVTVISVRGEAAKFGGMLTTTLPAPSE